MDGWVTVHVLETFYRPSQGKCLWAKPELLGGGSSQNSILFIFHATWPGGKSGLHKWLVFYTQVSISNWSKWVPSFALVSTFAHLWHQENCTSLSQPLEIASRGAHSTAGTSWSALTLDRKQQGTPCTTWPECAHISNCLLYLSWAAIEFGQFAEFAVGLMVLQRTQVWTLILPLDQEICCLKNNITHKLWAGV